MHDDGWVEADDVTLPRLQTGAPPQHLITTLLGDHWFHRAEPLPSAALVRLRWPRSR